MSTLPKLVTVELESPSSTVFQDVGVSPTPHSSFQWKSPPLAKRARASPVTGRLSPVIGANQSGEAIAAGGRVWGVGAGGRGWLAGGAGGRGRSLSSVCPPPPHPMWVVHWS